MANQNGNTLSLANVISVTVLPTPATLGEVNINTVCLFTYDQPSGWDDGQTYAIYKDPAAVATDFGADSNAAAIAASFFAQTPNPVGTDGYLAIVPLDEDDSVVDGIVTIGDSFFYYGILIDSELAADNPTEFGILVAYVQSVKKMIGYCSSRVADLNPGSPLDLVRQASETRGRMFYYGEPTLNGNGDQQTQMFAAAYLARGLSVDFSGVGTAITMNGKPLVGFIPDQTVGQTQLNLAIAAGVDVYVKIGTSMVYSTGANDYFDDVYNEDWFAQALQVGGFNYLIPTAFKIPQTETGMNGLKGAYRAVCEQAKSVGVIAPGEWTSAVPAGVPQDLFLQNIRTVGYFVFSQPVAKQSAADRAARKAPLVQIAAKLAGAVHSSDVLAQIEQ